MPVTLHTDPHFPCPQRLQLVIEHLNLPLQETFQYNILKGEQKTERLLKINPAGSVPFIEDELDAQPFFLAESRAIARYLVARYGKDSGLMPDPSNLGEYAKFEQAAAVEVAGFDPAANPLVLEEHFKPNLFERDPDLHLAQWLRKRLDPVLSNLNNTLKTQPFMAGEKLTLVDFFYVPYTHYLVEIVWPSCFEERPHLAAWWASMTKLAAYKSVYGSKE
ncbi:hypothetical protein VHEMI07471 [[Torrubiella] hemipterigena]|uniref:Glutathione S-transferase n=1 Tax=[Torrubiella] hemipterigena TaxID=1531966 RepID=A0A0A1TAI2_9HYPO|nr:hypothetical protein VHEMI07471 [[Torrubiella] hemipterigena]